MLYKPVSYREGASARNIDVLPLAARRRLPMLFCDHQVKVLVKRVGIALERVASSYHAKEWML